MNDARNMEKFLFDPYHADSRATERNTHVQVEQTKPLVEARWARLVVQSGTT